MSKLIFVEDKLLEREIKGRNSIVPYHTQENQGAREFVYVQNIPPLPFSYH